MGTQACDAVFMRTISRLAQEHEWYALSQNLDLQLYLQ